MSKANGIGVVRFIRDAAGADNCPDGELVRRFAADADERAFRTLVSRHGPVVWAVCRRMLGNHHDAEDAFQATFLVFARKAGGIHSAVAGWLCGVAARVAARVRSARRLEPMDAEPAVGHADGAIGELTVREAEVALYEELARLPEKYRAALVLCCLEGLSRDEAADRLGWTENRVKHCLERGRERLRSQLARRGIALGLPLLAGLLEPASGLAAPLADAAVRHATGTQPPAAVSSLAHGVSRVMCIAKWKWVALAGWAAVVLSAGAAAAVLLPAPEPPPPAAQPGVNLVLAAAPTLPAKPPGPQKPTPMQPWEVATEFLQFIIDGKPEQAQKLGDRLDEKAVKELQVAGLKRAKLALVLVNDFRALVVTERAKLKRSADAKPTDEHAVVQLERKDAKSPWRVTETDVADEGAVWRDVDDYLEGQFNHDREPKKDAPEPAKGAKEPAWAVAEEFLKLALAGKTADALKLVVPGTVSENKVGEVRQLLFASTAPVAVLINDTRMEVAFQQQRDEKGKDGHLVLMLTKSKDGVWQVKDIDFRNEDELEPRVKLYLAGNYNSPDGKQ